MDSPSTVFSLSPLLYLAAGVLALIIGNQLTRRIGLLREFCIPRPVTGGLLFAACSWLLASSSPFELQLNGALESSLWHTLFSVGPQSKPMLVDQPFLIAFFTCVGLSCSADAVRKGGRSLIVLLVAASCLALAQAILGIGTAAFFGVHPAVGLACGPVSMTGGHGTTAGFAELLQSTGLEDPRAIGFSAATFGLFVGGIVSGPLGSLLVRRHGLAPSGEDVPETAYARSEGGLLGDLRAVSTSGARTLLLLSTLLLCFKLGAWLSYGLAGIGLIFPVYMGSMIVGALLRNLVPERRLLGFDDLLQAVRSICIGMFLVLALMNTSFTSLADVAVVMLVILVLQVLLAVAFALWVTYRFAGRNYDAAMVAAGHCGFALGATPNALAAMDAISRRHGRVFRPFLAVSVAGGFFLDFTNALVITAAANWIMA
jgi:ESS family glutamate:Na+ symporter